MLGACIALFLMRQSKDKPAQAIGEKTPDNSRYFGRVEGCLPGREVHPSRPGRSRLRGFRLVPQPGLASADILGKFGSRFFAKAYPVIGAIISTRRTMQLFERPPEHGCAALAISDGNGNRR